MADRYSGPDAIKALIERPDLANLLIDAVKRSNGRTTFEIVLQELLQDKANLWIRKNSVITTQTVLYQTGARWLTVRMGAGHMKTLQAMMPALEAYAKEIELDGVEGLARPGWSRVGKRLGYEETHRFLEKRFT